MLTGESRTFLESSHEASVRREFELAVRELEMKRREENLRRQERAAALPRMPASYFNPGNNAHEDDWWAKQFGRRVA